MDDLNFIANIKKKNKRALEFVVDHYSNLVCKVILSVFPANNFRRYFLGEGIENIARSFSVDRNVVDKRLSRGRQYLKEKLVLLKGEML